MLLTVTALRKHRFPLHGELRFDWVGSLLHTQARGPFNLEMVQAGMRRLKGMGDLWPADGRLIELVEWHECMLMPPEAFADWETRMDRIAAAGYAPKLNLIVAPKDIEGRWPMLDRYAAVYRRSRVVEVFEALEPALARAQQQMEAWASARPHS